jgi:anti-anti-sigma factor
MPYLLTLTAEQTIYQAPALQQQLAEALRQHPDLLLDLSQVSEIDCAGVQVLLWLQAVMAKQGHSLRLCQPSQAVSHFLQLMGFTQLQACMEGNHES